MQIYLKYGIIFSIIFSLISLFYLLIKTLSYGRKPLYSKPQENNIKGILYAFWKGILPWEKESAKNYLLSYIAGIIYHLGIFSALFYIISLIFNLFFFNFFITILRLFLITGIICGLGLLFKRIFIPQLRLLSYPDDFFSNILVNFFLIFTLLDTFTLNIRILYFLITIILFIYIPIGKIRHCFFFFCSRALFGVFFGRRGILQKRKFN
jgi:hypothetical protein